MLRLLFLSLIYSIYSQSIIRIGILDDNENSDELIHLNQPNITFCGKRGLNFQLHWINNFNLLNKLESEENQTNIYLTYTEEFSTKLIQDFCQINRIPFINLKTNENLCSLTSSFNREYFLRPNILHVLINYLKSNGIENAVYIYDKDQSKYRIFELLELMNNDEYFNTFLLDIRIRVNDDDIYSLLYNIEANSYQKNRLFKYILLDFYSFDQYEKIFEQISHMGLTSPYYKYIILSTFDACLWINKLNFTGQIIYFDYQKRDCIYDPPPSYNLNKNPSLSVNVRHNKSYYRSSLSFRHDLESSKSLSSSEYSSINVSLLYNNTNRTFNSCYSKMKSNEEYFSFSSLDFRLPSQLYSHALYNSLNLIVRMITSNLLDCKTYRFKSLKSPKINRCQYADMNIYSRSKSSPNQLTQQTELIGRYSTMNNHYQSCQIDKTKGMSRDEKFPSRIYYITSLFDEPFLMLRKRTSLHAQYNHPDADLNQLRGRVFDLDELEGFCVDLAEQICSILNITCRFRIVEDGNFGSKNSTTGIWNGMVGEIVSRKADMAIGPLTISQERIEVVDFSKPFMNLGISIMIRKPDKQKPGVFSFMNPVSMEIWLCLSLAYVAVSAVLFLTSRLVNSGWRRRVIRRPSYRSFSYPKSVDDRRKSEIELHRQRRDSMMSVQSNEFPIQVRPSVRRRYHYRTRPHATQNGTDSNLDNKKKDDEHNKSSVHIFGISNALFFSFSSFMRQSINLVPKSLSGRIAATSWWYFSLIFISSYTANLVAFLTVEKLVTPIENVEDLAKQQEIKYGLIKNGTTSAFFERSNVTLFQQMWTMMQENSADVLVDTNDEAVVKVRNSKGKYAVFIESTKNEYVNERLPCDTMKVGSDLDSKGYGIATGLGSSLTEAINIIITNLRESGFVDKLKQRWWYDRSECAQTSKDKHFSELSLSSVTGLFYIFLIGIILSCTIAFTEFIITAKHESQTLNIDLKEILRIKMIENMIGITIKTQQQLEYGNIENESNDQCGNDEEEDHIIKQYTEYQLQKPQSDV